MARQLSPQIKGTRELTCFCTEPLGVGAGDLDDLRLGCGCAIHYHCLVAYLQSKIGDRGAAGRGDAAVVRSLLAVSCIEVSWYSAYYAAVNGGHTEIAQALLNVWFTRYWWALALVMAVLAYWMCSPISLGLTISALPTLTTRLRWPEPSRKASHIRESSLRKSEDESTSTAGK